MTRHHNHITRLFSSESSNMRAMPLASTSSSFSCRRISHVTRGSHVTKHHHMHQAVPLHPLPLSPRRPSPLAPCSKSCLQYGFRVWFKAQLCIHWGCQIVEQHAGGGRLHLKGQASAACVQARPPCAARRRWQRVSLGRSPLHQTLNLTP